MPKVKSEKKTKHQTAVVKQGNVPAIYKYRDNYKVFIFINKNFTCKLIGYTVLKVL